MTVALVAKWTVFVGLVLWMIRAGFLGPPRLFTWPMFSRVSQARRSPWWTTPAGRR